MASDGVRRVLHQPSDPTGNTPESVRDGSRDGLCVDSAAGRCVICGQPVRRRSARYCSRACRQRAYRRRHDTVTIFDEVAARQELRRRRALSAQTIYECPDCGVRFLGEQRCPDCNRFCRALGLGGHCPECDAAVLLQDVLDGAGSS